MKAFSRENFIIGYDIGGNTTKMKQYEIPAVEEVLLHLEDILLASSGILTDDGDLGWIFPDEIL